MPSPPSQIFEEAATRPRSWPLVGVGLIAARAALLRPARGRGAGPPPGLRGGGAPGPDRAGASVRRGLLSGPGFPEREIGLHLFLN
jgi:hypothetical protein